jgi:hypothetical protein
MGSPLVDKRDMRSERELATGESDSASDLPYPICMPGKRVHGKPCREFESRPIRS